MNMNLRTNSIAKSSQRLLQKHRRQFTSYQFERGWYTPTDPRCRSHCSTTRPTCLDHCPIQKV
ncbi:hypothetical protein M378DRAFT_163826 [Amanita muscaria Koide BX008]|uniref:Uncharacterized protein n=1 Tax=Amanita muscaria (strain Koide BX008) TaxID=946122 RepID=A0A0C2WQF3_AMAMK|nr:hypothetical protein M378DRAFT_163826 [Amanita muscaria Koide BX008]